MPFSEFSRPREAKRVAVIGAGIVGCSCALALAAQGWEVTVLDPAEPGSKTSFGNAGAIVTGAVMPLATPGVLRSLPFYLFDRNAPAVMRLKYLPRAAPWLWRFFRAGRRSEVDRISEALAALTGRALDAYRPLLTLSGAQDMVTQEGWLKVYGSEEEFAATALERDLSRRAGVSVERLDRAALTDLEPNLAPELCACGLFQPTSGFVRNPEKLASAFLSAARKMGAGFVQRRVEAIRAGDEKPALITSGGEVHRFAAVVVAAGAWSGELVRSLGDKVCLETERGYHMAFSPESSALLNRPVSFPGQGMVLSPMAGGLRVLNGSEMAGLRAAPDYRRIQALAGRARDCLPALASDKAGREWMGHRPSTPDTLPVIGRSPRHRNIFYAFGHGHLGLTLAARTAEMIAAEIGQDSTPEAHQAYSIARFGTR